MARKQDLPDFVAPKVAAEIESWLQHLGAERRMSPKTVEAYRRDVLQFLEFLAPHPAEHGQREYQRKHARRNRNPLRPAQQGARERADA